LSNAWNCPKNNQAQKQLKENPKRAANKYQQSLLIGFSLHFCCIDIMNMENRFFLQPAEAPSFEGNSSKKNLLSSLISKHTSENYFPDISDCQIAIIGVEESRNASGSPIATGGPDMIRRYLYNLHQGAFKVQIADLGNIISGNTIDDTYVALTEVVVELLENKVIPVILGGSQDLTWACYKAYEKLKRTMNIVAVDKLFDLGTEDNALTSESYLKKIIVQEPNYLVQLQQYRLSDLLRKPGNR
jgi:formiminoglutamase